MDTETVYARISAELKNKLISFAKSSGKQQGEALAELLTQGFMYSDSQDKLDETNRILSKEKEDSGKLKLALENTRAELTMAKQRLGDAERANGHLQRILNIEVGKCGVCNDSITLYGFAYQQCPKGHSGKIELYDVYKKNAGVGDVIVASLAIFGGVALAAELLGGKGSEGKS